MSFTGRIHIPVQYLEILDACRENDMTSVGESLRELMHDTGKSKPVLRDLRKIYSRCMVRLLGNGLYEIYMIFTRLVNGLKSMIVRNASSTDPARSVDITIEELSENNAVLHVSDPELADLLISAEGFKLKETSSVFEQNKGYDFTISGSDVQTLKDSLRIPRYVSYMAMKSRLQLSMDLHE